MGLGRIGTANLLQLLLQVHEDSLQSEAMYRLERSC
jgi:hypothetical protein